MEFERTGKSTDQERERERERERESGREGWKEVYTIGALIKTERLTHFFFFPIDALRCTDNLFISFIEGCLKWKVEERLTPEEAMQHKWIQEGHMTVASYRSHRNLEGTRRSPYGKHKTSLHSKPYMSYLKSSHDHLTQTYGKSLSHIPPSGSSHNAGHSAYGDSSHHYTPRVAPRGSKYGSHQYKINTKKTFHQVPVSQQDHGGSTNYSAHLPPIINHQH